MEYALIVAAIVGVSAFGVQAVEHGSAMVFEHHCEQVDSNGNCRDNGS